MAVAVQMPQRREEKDPLDTIAKALGIASAIYGIKDAGVKADLLRSQAEKQNQLTEMQVSQLQREQAGLLSPDKRAALLPNLQKASPEDKGSFEIRSSGGVDESGNPKVVSEYFVPIKQKDAALEMAKLNLLQKKLEASQGKIIPASEAVQFGTSSASFDALQNASDLYEKNADIAGPFKGKGSSFAGKYELGDVGKRAKAFDAQLKINAQSIGKALEGGKLTDADIDRYRDMLPNLSDSKDAAKEKIAILQQMISAKQESDLRALQGAGYNVGNIPRSVLTVPQRPPSAPANQEPSDGILRGIQVNNVVAGGQPKEMRLDLSNQPGAQKPQTINQSGYIYKLNPKTGNYE